MDEHVDHTRVWWDGLTPEERRAVADDLPDEPRLRPGCDWTRPWSELLPYTQRTRLRLYHARVVERRLQRK